MMTQVHTAEVGNTFFNGSTFKKRQTLIQNHWNMSTVLGIQSAITQ